MIAAILIPWRPGCPVRERNYARVRAWWDALGYSVFEGDSCDPYFSCAASRNQAAAAAGMWDVAVFSDADILPGSPEQIRQAIKTAAKTGAFTVAHSEYRWLGEAETARVCAGLAPAAAEPDRAMTGAWIGTFAIRHDLFGAAGGYDEGFQGWGQQDVAFYKAAATLGGYGRAAGALCHLWHPPRPEEERVAANWDRELRYDAAYGDPERMRALIAERS